MSEFSLIHTTQAEQLALLVWMKAGMLTTTPDSAAWIKAGATFLYMLCMATYLEVGTTRPERKWFITGYGEAELERLSGSTVR